jgi:phosphate acetyltransferase
MDVALNREIGIKKGVNPVFSGKINVFIFPDIDSGNITYKTFQEIGGYHAIGPIIQGLEKPMMDLSRGCKIDDILDLTRIAISFI